MQKHIGTFQIESGKVMVADPCYKRETQYHGTLKNVKKGTWLSDIEESDEGDWGHRVSELRCHHENYHNIHAWEKTKFEVGVDSGQAGIFDNKYYWDDEIAKTIPEDQWMMNPQERICEDKPWYSLCCDRTLSKQQAGTIPFGVVSSSGFGDGCYDCFFHKNDAGEIDAIKIVFITDKNEECDKDDNDE